MYTPSHLLNILARKSETLFSKVAKRYWHDFPLGKRPLATKAVYEKLWREEKEKSYTEIDAFEKAQGFSVNKKWFHELALHTQIVIKSSPLCYQHGRILYSVLSHYLSKQTSPNLTIYETGTARGFSAVIMSKALKDAKASGKILTFDVLPNDKKIFWNCIDDHDGPKSRKELLSPWKKLVEENILFIEGDSRLNLSKVKLDRIHFAFLDGAHSYEHVLFEFGIIAGKQIKGDIIVFDDYNHDDFAGLVKAVDHGCKKWGYEKIVINIGRSRGYAVTTKR